MSEETKGRLQAKLEEYRDLMAARMTSKNVMALLAIELGKAKAEHEENVKRMAEFVVAFERDYGVRIDQLSERGVKL